MIEITASPATSQLHEAIVDKSDEWMLCEQQLSQFSHHAHNQVMPVIIMHHNDNIDDLTNVYCILIGHR